MTKNMMSREECMQHIESIIGGLERRFGAVENKMDELTRIVKTGNGHQSLMEQAERNTIFRERWEEKWEMWPTKILKWWIATMLTLISSIFGIVYFVLKVL